MTCLTPHEKEKADFMRNNTLGIAFLCLLVAGCTALSNQSKKDEYERTMFAYDTAMRLSDFNSACKFVAPATMAQEDCLDQYANLKIVSYTILSTKMSEDEWEADQRIEMEYHFLDRVVVKKITFRQSWGYMEESKTWKLKNAPPTFE